MKTIWKYDIEFDGTTEPEVLMRVPKGARFLHVETGRHPTRLVVFAEVTPPHKGVELDERMLYFVATGANVPLHAKGYIGTAMELGGFDWHVYEDRER